MPQPTIDQQLEELTRPTANAYNRGREDALKDRDIQDLLGIMGIGAVLGAGVKESPLKQYQSLSKEDRLVKSLEKKLGENPKMGRHYREMIKNRRAIMAYKKLNQQIVDNAKENLFREGFTEYDIQKYPSVQKRLSNLVKQQLEFTHGDGVDAIGAKVGDKFVKESTKENIFQKYLSPYARKKMHMVKPSGSSIYDYRQGFTDRVVLQQLLQDAKDSDVGVDTYYYQKKPGKKGSKVTLSQDAMRPEYIDTPETRYAGLIERGRALKEMKEAGVTPQDMHLGNWGRDPVTGKVKAIDLGHSTAANLRELINNADLRDKVNVIKNVGSKENQALAMKVAKEYAKRLPGETGKLIDEQRRVAIAEMIANRVSKSAPKVAKGALKGVAKGAGLATLGLIPPSDEPVSMMPGKFGLSNSISEVMAHIFGPVNAGNAELPDEEMLNRQIINERIKLKKMQNAMGE